MTLVTIFDKSRPVSGTAAGVLDITSVLVRSGDGEWRLRALGFRNANLRPLRLPTPRRDLDRAQPRALVRNSGTILGIR